MGDSTYQELLGELIDGMLLRLWTATPGQVVAYDAASQTATVQPLPYEWDGDGGQEALPVLPGVPVMFPRGNGFAMTWPLAKGDHVLLVFCRRSIERWRASGSNGDPQSDRRHNISDAFAIPGAFHAGGKLADVPTSDVEIREPTGGIIKVGKGATHAAMLGDTFVSAMSSLLTALSTHTHVTAVGPTMPPSNAATILASSTGTSSVLSTKVKVK